MSHAPDADAARERLPRTLAALEAGLGTLHLGAQLCVSLRGEVVADAALGESRPGTPATRDTLMLWMSSGKPVTALLIARLVDRGLIDVGQRVAEFVPEFDTGGKGPITLANVLTHTGGFRRVGTNWTTEPWEAIIARICAAALDDDWTIGETAAYHIASGWYVLAEIARRALASASEECEPWQMYRREVFGPLGMTDCWAGMPRHRWMDYGTRIGLMFDTSKRDEGPRPVSFPNGEQGSVLCRPGGNLRGPMSGLVTMYETLVRDRDGAGRFLSEEVARAFTTRQRVGLTDKTFNAEIDWGYGFLINSEGGGRIPYGYGPHASPEAFGHSGNQSSCAFADPKHELAAAWATNGQPGELAHQKRQRAINAAVYEDLGLTE